jgi:hypothetical protein
MAESKEQEEFKYEKTVFCNHEIRLLEFEHGKYINANDLGRAGGKPWSNYKKLKDTDLFLTELSGALLIRRADLVKSETKNCPERGTWIHPHVAIDYAPCLLRKRSGSPRSSPCRLQDGSSAS